MAPRVGNYPPGLPGRILALAARLPGGLNMLAQPLRPRRLRRLPAAYGWLSKQPVPAEVTGEWLRPLLTQRAIRRDLRKYARSAPSRIQLLEWAERQRVFDRPALVVWALEDKVMPPRHGRRLADLFPGGRLVEITDSYTLIPEDQPARLTALIRQFLAYEPGQARSPAPSATARQCP